MPAHDDVATFDARRSRRVLTGWCTLNPVVDALSATTSSKSR